MWMEALRVCTDYMPAKLSALQTEYDKTVGTRNTRDVGVLLNEARQWENNGQYLTAVKCYLKVKLIKKGIRKFYFNQFHDVESTSLLRYILLFIISSFTSTGKSN